LLLKITDLDEKLFEAQL
jgi:hypothetical protein